MTRQEALAEAARRNTSADTDTHWIVTAAGDDEWDVARVRGAGLGAVHPTGSRTESRPKPEEPPDPRPSIIRNIPPFGPG